MIFWQCATQDGCLADAVDERKRMVVGGRGRGHGTDKAVAGR
jgi:hypothetical protein